MRNRRLPTLFGSDQQQGMLRDVSRLQRNIDEIFQDFLSPVTDPALAFVPQVDVEENDDSFLLSFDLPGVSKDNIKIEIQDNQLVVSGERREERSEDRSRRSSERFYGFFQRMFMLPSNVDPNRIEADYRDGVLWLAIPKTEGAQQRRIQIGERKSGLLERVRQAVGGTLSDRSEQQQRQPREQQPKQQQQQKKTA